MDASNRVIFKNHAVLRMLERGITKSEVLHVIDEGEVIEQYPDDKPYPSSLMFGMAGNRPLHVVVACNEEEQVRIVVKVYSPDTSIFMGDFRTRKK